jgi:hypothetical protein
MSVRSFLLVGILAVAVVLATLGFFVAGVAEPAGFKLSNSAEQWGQLGDYFGGTLNPAFAFLSFLAVLFTLRQNSLGKMQDDFLKLAASASERLESHLNRIPSKPMGKSLPETNTLTIGEAYLTAMELRWKRGPKALPYVEAIANSTIFDFNLIGRELGKISDALILFEKYGGDKQVSKFFVDYYRDYYIAMIYVGIIVPIGSSSDFFSSNVCWFPDDRFDCSPEKYRSS